MSLVVPQAHLRSMSLANREPDELKARWPVPPLEGAAAGAPPAHRHRNIGGDRQDALLDLEGPDTALLHQVFGTVHEVGGTQLPQGVFARLVAGEDQHCRRYMIALFGRRLRSLLLARAANDEGHVVGAVSIEIALGLGDLGEPAPKPSARPRQRPSRREQPGLRRHPGRERGQCRQGKCDRSQPGSGQPRHVGQVLCSRGLLGSRQYATYAGMRHGWVPSDTPVHDPEGAERHFQALRALYASAPR